MKFIWEAEDIAHGLRIVQPAKGTTAVIAWFGQSGDRRSTIVETNTDGMIHMQYLRVGKDKELEKCKEDKLVPRCFTPKELADHMNGCTYPWVPAALFTGSGVRLKTDGRGAYKKANRGLKDLKDLKG